MFPSNSFRINTCESVSKQRTLTPFRMNPYEKGGRGRALFWLFLLTANAHRLRLKG
jgi:hypothetical protein